MLYCRLLTAVLAAKVRREILIRPLRVLDEPQIVAYRERYFEELRFQVLPREH